MKTFERTGKMSEANRLALRDWAIAQKKFMYPTMNGYADGRLEMSIRRHVRVGVKKNGITVTRIIGDQFKIKHGDIDRIEKLGEHLLPGFHQGLLLFYPEGSFMKAHRDAPAYAKGTVSLNIESPVIFSISNCNKRENMQDFLINPGEAVLFNNMQPHSVATTQGDRWCLCFFKLKPEVLLANEGSTEGKI
jgi:hypothetical protein